LLVFAGVWAMMRVLNITAFTMRGVADAIRPNRRSDTSCVGATIESEITRV
jgi:hypothetical protein